jgi:DNA-binding response OmpR family regulator
MFIAVLEDDPGHAKLLSMWLDSAGHTSKVFSTGESFIENVAKEPFGMMILDWSLPDIDGDEVLVWIRENMGWEIPVLFMTFRDAAADITKILKLGADDYVTKAVTRDEFLARVDSLHRRSVLAPQVNQVIKVGEFELDTNEFSVKRHGQEVKLTPKELKLALYLFQNINHLRSRADLLANVWGRNAEISTRTVDLHISRIRKKLGLIPENDWELESVSSVGYRLTRLKVDEDVESEVAEEVKTS